MTAASRVLALATLLAVGAQTLSTGGADGRQTTSGVERYSKLDRFLHDRMGLPSVFGGGLGNRSGPPAPTTDRGLLSRTAAASAAAPEDEDDGNADNEEDGDDDDDDDEPRDDDDELRDDDEQEDEEDEVTPEPFVRFRHRSAAAVAAERNFGVYGKDIQKQEPARTMSTMTETKWNLLGSRKKVEETFRNPHRISLLQGGNEGGEALKHQLRISKEASCKVPRSRVIKVADVYPSSNKKYSPACTVLHVCADDTGCCNSPTLKCGPKTSQQIYLPFMVYTLPGLEDRQSSEKLSYQKSLAFYNHTECECQSRADEMPRDTMPTASMEVPDPPPRPSIRHRPVNNNQYSCKCPTEYTVRYLANGSCSCDCFDKQRECIRYKKGNVYFNHLDTYCITSGQCLLPMCEYGVYSSRTRRCPKQFETLYSLKKKHYF